MAVEAPASLEDFARVPTFGSSPGTAVDGRGPCIKQLISESRLMPDEQLPIGDLTEFVRNDGLSSWFLFLRQADLANAQLSADRIFELTEISQKIENYSAEVDHFLDSPDVAIDRKLRVLLYNLAFVAQLVRSGSDEVADIVRTQLAMSDFMVRQIQWLQHPVFIDMILFAYSQFESGNAVGGAGPVAIPPPGHEPVVFDSSHVVPHFGTFKLATMRSSVNEPIEVTVEPDFVSLGALQILFENLLSPRQGAKVVAETALFIYTIYSRSQLSVRDSQFQRKYIFLDERENRSKPSEGVSRLPLKRLIEDTLRPSLLDFHTHPLITLFFLQLDLHLFETIQRTGRQLSFENANVLKMFSPVFARVLDFNFFEDLFALDDPPVADSESNQPVSYGTASVKEDDPQIALHMLKASGYAYEHINKDAEFLRKYFQRLGRIINSGRLKHSDHFFNSLPKSHAIYTIRSGHNHPPSSSNPLVYNLPSSVARTLLFSILELFLKPHYFSSPYSLVPEILNFKIGPAFILDDGDGKPPTPDAGGSFANQAQFLRKTLGIPSDLPTSKSLDGAPPFSFVLPSQSNLVSRSAAGESDGQSTVFSRALDGFYKWKLGFRDLGTRKAQERNSPQKRRKEDSRLERIKPASFFGLSNRNRLPLEVDKKRHSIELQEDILKLSSFSAGNDLDRSFKAKYSFALIVQGFKAEIEKIDADVREIHGWAMDKENGIIHWMNYLSLTWLQKVNGVDEEDLKLVIERINHDLELYLEVRDLCEKNENIPVVQLIQTQLNKRIELTREIRDSLISIFYHLIVENSDGTRKGDELHRIRIRMIHIGFEFPD